MSTEECAELDQMATALAYEYILFSGLYKSLSNEAWDSLAKQIGTELRNLAEQRVNEQFTKLEAVGATGEIQA